MGADIHAIAILATLGVPLAFLAFSHMRRPQSRLFIVQGSVVIAVGIVFQLTLCAHGAPVAEWLFPLVALGVCAYLKNQRVSKRLGWLTVAAALLLCMNSMELRFSGRYTSEPGAVAKGYRTVELAHFTNAKKALRQQFAPDKTLPEGAVGHYDRAEFDDLWHTPITGLRAVRSIPGEIWYPGGPVGEGSSRLEWREKK